MRSAGPSPAARFITTVRWEDLPEAVTSRAALCLVDTVAAMLAGRAAPSARIAADLASAWWGTGDAHLVLDGRRIAAPGAGFANAVAANAVDIDDVGIYTWGHPGAQVVPAALALAEQRRLDGRGLLTAIVVGYEIAFRAGRCVNVEASKVAAAQRTYRACGSWGSVACAAIASYVLGLDETATRHALGIAEYHSPDLPLMRDLDAPAMVKHGVGPGVITGLLAAELASRGFTGIAASLDLAEFRDFAGDLGTGYLLPHGITWKRFSSCAWTHPALLAVESLMTRHAIAPDRIANVLIETYPDAARLGTRLPSTTEEAQFNLAWPVAAMLADGQVGPAQVLGARLGSAAVTDLARRIEVRVSSELTRLYYLSEVNDPDGQDAAVVTITLRDGTVLSSGLTENVLYPEPGWGPAEIGEKFRWLAAGHVKAAAINDLLSRLLDVATVPDVSVLMSDLASFLLPALPVEGSMGNSPAERPPLVSRRMMMRGAVAAAGAVAVGGLAGCGSSASGSAASGSAASASSSSAASSGAVTADPALHAMLPASIRSAGMIRVATNIPYPPWEMYTTAGGNQPTGIDYDLSQAIGAKLGVTARFDQTDFDSIVPAILAGKEDIVMAGIWDTTVREKALSFVDYAHDDYAILVKKGNPRGIATADDLAGKTVAVQSSTTEQSSVDSFSRKLKSQGKQGINVLAFPEDSDALLAVQSGRADCRVEATSAAAYAVKTYGNGTSFQLVQSPTVVATFGGGVVGLGVPKSDTALLNAIQQAVQALMTDGAYAKIMDTYGTSLVGITTAGINQGPKQT